MKKIFYILLIAIIVPNGIEKNNSYYIYLFHIDKNDNITLINSKTINNKLKISGQEKKLNESILVKALDTNNEVLYSYKFLNPKLVYSEDIQHGKKDFYMLDETYFVIKIPTLEKLNYIDFYLSSELNKTKNKKLNRIINNE